MLRFKYKTGLEILMIAICGLYLHSCKKEIGKSVASVEHTEWAPDAVGRKKVREVLDPEEEKKMKKILAWNSYNYKISEGHSDFHELGCRYTDCVFTMDRRRYPLEEVDAILWHVNAADQSFPDERLRSPHTRYIIVTHEASYHVKGVKNGQLSRYNGVFNWTFHFRHDSDICAPYGRIDKIPEKKIGKLKPVMSQKTRMAAWFVSDCESRSQREDLVKQLQKHFEVDIFGACGPLTCIRDGQKCFELVEKKYFFYFSFENSLCEDYITEKLYYTLRSYVVPVVWGLGNYVKNAPPHSVVNALAFQNVTALANYLIYLRNNQTAYYEYFLWKKNYAPTIRGSILQDAMCEICERLHTDNSTKVYDDIYTWFAPDRQCLSPGNQRIAKYLGL